MEQTIKVVYTNELKTNIDCNLVYEINNQIIEFV